MFPIRSTQVDLIWPAKTTDRNNASLSLLATYKEWSVRLAYRQKTYLAHTVGIKLSF